MIVLSSDVFCDGADCSLWVEGTTGLHPHPTKARKIAQSKGWERVRQSGRLLDLCPRCFALYMAERERR